MMINKFAQALALTAFTFGTVTSSVRGQTLTDADLDKVKARLAEGAVHSWELGTRSEALVELDSPAYSVFNGQVPPPQHALSSLNEILDIARSIVANRATSNNNTVGPQPLIADGAAADPASNLFEVIVANWTGQKDQDYAGAAKDQIDFLFQNVSHTSDGAISHRADDLQLWSDFVYMVPPCLAYYGVITRNQSMVAEADTAAGNMWQHVLLGFWQDHGHWTTGNGWAAAGMLRVAATMKNSPYNWALLKEQSDLLAWTSEIHTAIYPYQDKNTSLFWSYADNNATFIEASGATLLAATVYRLVNLGGPTTHIPNAEATRKAISAKNATTGAFIHLDADGWLTPVVNPDDFSLEGSASPEGQAFVLDVYSAWKDWVKAGSKGAPRKAKKSRLEREEM
ncbi:hypothetical protein PUNSTDRAFT_128484 [Punctularia strigosozonata HHB-11173 SS5]|uniref:Six-hairpin glycosidase n=1 Tax=Punctularia strigosozonata (strain HHB-11173) TaxID=741275 RepID=R7S2X1_PUNST|nr:uncharacterized protein PUNSTDRAFT_128484 [Punctularia strigosozonata HHB-11173 SS5]EIN04194.1 hypothetical protein PUNSTDRAFT_128484 [Punctularia strigosozonata HHB-11173 SS5]